MDLARLLRPRSVAVLGGKAAAAVIRQLQRLGYAGEIWPVNPGRTGIEGVRAFPNLASLPGAPDCAFLGVPAEACIAATAELSAMGCGGVVCFASGFAEAGDLALQERLRDAAGAMPLLGPNCHGFVNALDRVALWPDEHGMRPVERGVAIVSQSGNIAINLTMQKRSLPIAVTATLGNQAVTDAVTVMGALLDDPRITAIGLQIEGLADITAFSVVAREALVRRIPVVALKIGRSDAGARATVTHTSTLAGPDKLYDALFARYGIARVDTVEAFLETLKLLHVGGALVGNRIASLSCSGGEAGLMGDLAEREGLVFPPLDAAHAARVKAALGNRVEVQNPLDYHTFIWNDGPALERCFTAMLSSGFDASVLVLDYPTADGCESSSWDVTLDAFIAAQKVTGARAIVVASLPECLPENRRERLIEAGIAPLQGMQDALTALAAAARIGAAWAEVVPAPLSPVQELVASDVAQLDEPTSKRLLAEHGIPLPAGHVVMAEEVVVTGGQIGFPVVLKAVRADLAHKTEAGAVKVNLRDEAALGAALVTMRALSERFLVERMVEGAVAELLVGVTRDPQFGLVLIVGSGGVLAELVADTASVLLPASERDVEAAIDGLRVATLLAGHRGRPAGDRAALIHALHCVVTFAEAHADRLVDLDINPLLVLPVGRGVVAVDAVVRVVGQ